MTFNLDSQSVSDLIDFVDRNVRERGCDHSHRFSAAWATARSIDWDDLLDALESRGAFCDCEVVMNLDDQPLAGSPEKESLGSDDRWLLPPKFSATPDAIVNKLILSRANIGKNTHTRDWEWLVPAPVNAKPRKRVRKILHFFIGVESGMPAEIGFVTDVEPMGIAHFAHQIASSPIPELRAFDSQIASFIHAKIANLADGTPVGANIVDRVGIASKHGELNVHRVFLKR